MATEAHNFLSREQSRRIQVIRGLCIIGVLLVHNNPYALGTVLVRPLYNFCTATFFTLFGYLTVIPLKDIGTFYRRRIARILIPYLVWSLVFGAVSVLKHEFDIVSFMKELVTFRTCDIYYYFAVYIQFVLLTQLIGKMVQSKHWKIGFLITPTAYIPIYILVIMKNPLEFPWNAICCLVWFTFYYLGLCVRNSKIVLNVESSKKWLVTFVVISILQVAEGSTWYVFGDFDMATSQFKFTALIGTSISIILFLLYIQSGREMFSAIFPKSILDSRLIAILSRGLKCIGDDSFGIYLSHILMMSVLDKVLYIHMSKIFPLDATLLLLVEMIGIECCKKIFGRWSRFCGWVGLR